MTLNKVERNGNTVEMEIAQNKEEFELAVEQSYKKNAGKIFVQGFRKGKAPRKMIEKLYGEGVFYEDAVNLVYPKMYEEAIAESKIQPVDKPEVDIVEIGGDKGLVLKVTVTVKPDVKLGNYKGLKLEKNTYIVTDEEVEKEVKNLAEKNARLVSVDRPSEKGDTLTIDFEGFIDGKSFAGGQAKDFSLEIGSDMFIPGFEDQLIGKTAGQDLEVNVSFPEDYHMKDFAGKPAMFKVTIKEVKAKELPVLDDEFAKEISEHDTLDEVKKELKDKILEARQKISDDMLENAIVEKLIEGMEADIPKCMVDEVVSEIESEQTQRMAMQGMTMEQYFEVTGISPEDYTATMVEQAQHRTKARLALEQVAKQENIEVSAEECDEEITRLSAAYNMPFEQIKSLVPEAHLKADLASRKAIALIKSFAEITEAEPIDPTAEEKPKAKKSTKKPAKKDDAAEEVKEEEKEEAKKAKKPRAKKEASDTTDAE